MTAGRQGARKSAVNRNLRSDRRGKIREGMLFDKRKGCLRVILWTSAGRTKHPPLVACSASRATRCLGGSRRISSSLPESGLKAETGNTPAPISIKDVGTRSTLVLTGQGLFTFHMLVLVPGEPCETDQRQQQFVAPV